MNRTLLHRITEALRSIDHDPAPAEPEPALAQPVELVGRDEAFSRGAGGTRRGRESGTYLAPGSFVRCDERVREVEDTLA